MEEVLFTQNSSGENLVEFKWFLAVDPIVKTSGPTTNFLFRDAGTYPVAMIVKNMWDCTDSIVKVINVLEDFNVYIPNSFTPNGDKLNDIFKPVLRGAKNFNFAIYDRWGALIFETSDPASGWDGTFKDESCKQDSYTYRLTVSSIHGESKEYNGHVMLIR
jgi:gliding motility-associated-like protein